MNKIASGAQVNVYDMGTQVLKVPKSEKQAQRQFLKWGKLFEHKEEGRRVVRDLQFAHQGIKRILQQNRDARWSLGNPEFLDDGSIKQDKVRVLGSVLMSSSTSEARNLIDQYSDLYLYHCSLGFADIIFNCTVNNGVDGVGRVVQIDFGEVVFDVDQVVPLTATQKWLDRASYKAPFGRYKMPRSHKNYYRKRMEKVLTPESVVTAWPAAMYKPHSSLE